MPFFDVLIDDSEIVDCLVGNPQFIRDAVVILVKKSKIGTTEHALWQRVNAIFKEADDQSEDYDPILVAAMVGTFDSMHLQSFARELKRSLLRIDLLRQELA